MLGDIVDVMLAFATPIGLFIAFVGWRGRLLNQHPICRKCRFDLCRSLPLANRCPECGANLSSHRSVMIGSRRRVNSLMMAGLTIFGVAFSLQAGGVWAAYTRFDAAPYLPTWLLLKRACDGATVRVDELERRFASGQLSTVQANKLIDLALKAQANRVPGYHDWNTTWGQIIENARYRDLIDDAQWLTYVRGVIAVPRLQAFTVAPSGKEDEHDGLLYLQVSLGSVRAAWQSILHIDIDVHDIRIGGTPLDPAIKTHYSQNLHRHGENIGFRLHIAERAKLIEPDRTRVDVDVTIKVVEADMSATILTQDQTLTAIVHQIPVMAPDTAVSGPPAWP